MGTRLVFLGWGSVVVLFLGQSHKIWFGARRYIDFIVIYIERTICRKMKKFKLSTAMASSFTSEPKCKSARSACYHGWNFDQYSLCSSFKFWVSKILACIFIPLTLWFKRKQDWESQGFILRSNQLAGPNPNLELLHAISTWSCMYLTTN